MTLGRALILLLAVTLLCTLLGGVGGTLLGMYAPDFFLNTMDVSQDADIPEIGAGLGITQGMMAGVTLSIAAVAAVAWCQNRQAARRDANDPSDA